MIEWSDDLKLGMRFKSGETTVSREEIKRFAAEFDPQSFHLDKSAAEESVFAKANRLATSGGG
jgi:acyl dehydratase